MPKERLSALEKDLTNEAEERLARWANDTFMRCEVGQIKASNTLVLIAFVLTQALAAILALFNDENREMVLRDLPEMIKRQEKKLKEAQNEL